LDIKETDSSSSSLSSTLCSDYSSSSSSSPCSTPPLPSIQTPLIVITRTPVCPRATMPSRGDRAKEKRKRPLTASPLSREDLLTPPRTPQNSPVEEDQSDIVSIYSNRSKSEAVLVVNPIKAPEQRRVASALQQQNYTRLLNNADALENGRPDTIKNLIRYLSLWVPLSAAAKLSETYK
jgi:hypothetical protein